jgi:hypothetical protein
MTIDAKARIQVEGGSEALKEITGVARATRAAGAQSKRTSTEQQRASREAAKAAERQAREATRAAKAAATAEERAVKQKLAAIAKAEATRLRKFEQDQRAMTRAAKKAAAEQQRATEQSAKAQEKAARDSVGRRRRLIGGTATAVAAGGVAAAAFARGVVGQGSVADRIRDANAFKTSLITGAGQAGLTPERRDEIEASLLQTATTSGKTPLEFAAGLETAQGTFNAFELFADKMKEIAPTAKAAGTTIPQMIEAIGFVKQAFGLTGDEMVEAMNLMVAASSKGAINVKDFANAFAPVAGLFASSSNMKGLEGAREFFATAQSIGTLGAGAEISATMMNAFMAAISDVDTRKGLVTAIGLTETDTPSEIITKMATSAEFAKPEVRQKLFPERLSSRAVTAVLNAYADVESGRTDVDARTILGVTAEEGRQKTREITGELERSGVLEAEREAVRAQVEVSKNLADYNAQILMVLKASNDLESAFGSLAVWANVIAAMGTTAAIGKVLLGGAGGAAAAGATTAAAGAAGATGGAAMFAASAAGTAALWAGAGLAAGAGGYYGTKALGGDTAGAKLGSLLFEMFGDDLPNRSTQPVDISAITGNPEDAPSGPSFAQVVRDQKLAREQLAEQKRATAVLTKVADKLEPKAPFSMTDTVARNGESRSR